MNVLFTCGGTAGHINPAVALARLFQLRDPDCKVLFVGADGGMETRLVPKEGYDLRTVTITNFRRSFTPAAIGHNLKTVVNMGRSKKQAQRILKEFQPDLVVGTGGVRLLSHRERGGGQGDPHRGPRVQRGARPDHQGPVQGSGPGDGGV